MSSDHLQKKYAERLQIIPSPGGGCHAAVYGIDKGTLANYRSRREGCKFFKVNKRVFYRKDDFEKWFFGNPVLTSDSLPER